MESSIAEFLGRWPACELPPTKMTMVMMMRMVMIMRMMTTMTMMMMMVLAPHFVQFITNNNNDTNNDDSANNDNINIDTASNNIFVVNEALGNAKGSITVFTSCRINLSPFTKGCREWDASM